MILANEWLEAEINPKGAELKHLRSKAHNHEYLWHADPRYWAKTSPVLFPIVGALKGGTYQYGGNTYQLPRHGFARDEVFEVQQLSGAEAVFTLRDTDETHNRYPFAFRLALRYQLDGRALRCTYEVHNPDDVPLLFSIGGHPAFATPAGAGGLSYTDYYLEFPEDEALHCHALEDNLISPEIRTITLKNHRLPLRYDLFYGDALVLKTLKSSEISLRNHVNDRAVRFRFAGFPYFGIWAAKGADFVCLEPWCGIADAVGHNQRLEGKEGIQRLDGGITWTRSWEVHVE